MDRSVYLLVPIGKSPFIPPILSVKTMRKWGEGKFYLYSVTSSIFYLICMLFFYDIIDFVIAREDDFVQVKNDEKEGWCSLRYCEIEWNDNYNDDVSFPYSF